MTNNSDDDDPCPFTEPDEDPLTSKDSIYCSVFRGYFHPKSKQKIKPNHQMVSKIVDCNCKLHLVLLCSDDEEDDDDDDDDDDNENKEPINDENNDEGDEDEKEIENKF